MQTIEYRTMDKTRWGRGPWDAEPDKKQWLDQETSLPCLIVRNRMGGLCGYVGVHREHPWHGLDYDSDGPIEVDVHGGLTFASECGHGEDESEGICHRPDPDEPDDVWWFGFDCAHWRDFTPANHDYASRDPGSEYRSLAYVSDECRSLARQLRAVQA